MEFIDRLVRQFAIAFNTLLNVTLHVVAPRCDASGSFHLRFDIRLCANESRTFSVFPSQFWYRLVLLTEYTQDFLDQGMVLGRPKRFSFAMSAFSEFFRHLYVVNVDRQELLQFVMKL